MGREGFKNVYYYIGPEVDHTPLAGKKTLHVIGVRGQEQIIQMATDNGCGHVRLGVNKTFQCNKRLMETMEALIDGGFQVTMELPIKNYEWFVENVRKDILNNKSFVPLIYVELPNMDKTSPNLCVKIDDSDWAATNLGTWTYHYSELQDSNRFTSWEEHGNDEIIWTDEDQKKLMNEKRNTIYRKGEK